MPTPSTTRSTLQIGTYNTATDTWTQTLDLNDGTTFYIHVNGLTLDQPQIADVRSFNIRASGERVLRQQYKNRHIMADVWLRASPVVTSTLLGSVRSLLRAVERAPYRIRFAQPGASAFMYADVVKCVKSIPNDPQTILAGAIMHIKLDFECLPGFAADQAGGGTRHYLSNLVNNAGFEAPSGPGVPVFNDLLANFNAYAPQWKAALAAVSPVSWWRQSESSGTTLVDSAGTHPGTYTSVTLGQASFNADPASTSALYNGSSSTASVPFSSALNTSTWTAGGWMYLTGGAGTVRPLIVSMPDANHGWALYIDAVTSKFAVDMGTGSGAIFPTTTTVATTNTWYFFCATYDGTNVNLYINPTSSTPAVTQASAFGAATSGALTIGSWALQGAFLTGRAEDCFVCNTALSGATILSLYQAGGALTQDTFRYPDAVLADSPARYYRLDEGVGVTAVDATGNANGTYGASGVTYGVAGALTGDSDAAVTFTTSSGKVTVPTTNLPTFNAAVSMSCWVKFSSISAISVLMFLGNNTAHQTLQLYLSATGGLIADVSGTGATTASANLSVNVWHHVACTWDGTTLSTYLDGGFVASSTPGAQTLTYGTAVLGNNSAGSFPFAGSMDEAAIFPSALSGARILAEYNAGHNTPTTTANTMVVPNGTRISFGSPAWQAINNWQVRFRFVAALTATFYVHYTNANNYLAVTVTGAALTLVQVVAGTTNTLATQSIVLVNGIQYYIQITQFPAIDTYPQAQIQAVLKADSAGFPYGPILATAGPIALSSNSVANSGQPQIQAAGAALGIGGNVNGTHTVSLFGPGGWYFASAGTGASTGAWEQNTANTYPNGPITSFGAGRMDLAPVGTINAYWLNADSSSAVNVARTAMPVNAGGNTLAASVPIRSSGLSGIAVLNVYLAEYDSSGNAIRSDLIGTLTGNQSAWTTISGSSSTAANCAFVAMQVQVVDSSGSNNGTVWFDNCQVWNQTTTGQATMPYCELRVPQAPAQLIVSGLLGDMPSPAYLAFGTWFASWATNGSYTFGLGRRAQINANSQLVGNSQVYLGLGTGVLDSTAYGGYYIKTATNATSVEFDPPANFHSNTIAGIWQYFNRFRTTQATVGNVSLKMNSNEIGLGGFWVAFGSTITPVTAANTWLSVNAGLASFPVGGGGAITPNATGSGIYEYASNQWTDSTAGGSSFQVNWYAYFPIDANLLYGTVFNPGGTVTNSWQWVYNDAIGPSSQASTVWKWSTQATALPDPQHAVGGTGTANSTYISVNPVADQALTLDPLINANSTGVNQIVALLADNNAAVQSLACELVYTPLYLYPK